MLVPLPSETTFVLLPVQPDLGRLPVFGLFWSTPKPTSPALLQTSTFSVESSSRM
jgi:hypothetical protein